MRFVLFTFLVTFLSFSSVFAIDPHNPRILDEPLTQEEQEAFDRIAEEMVSMPAVLRNLLLQPIAKEEYMTRVMKFLRTNGGEAYSLTQDDLAKKKEAALLQARRKQLFQLLNNDNNLDAQVTLQEWDSISSEQARNTQFGGRLDQKKIEEEKKRIVDQRREYFREFDVNKDLVLSYQEMGTLGLQDERKALERETGQYEQYLFLDPNKDGQLTARELEEQALSVYAFFDKNADGYVDVEEREIYSKVVAMYGLSDRTADSSCRLEPVSKDLTLLGIGVIKGLALSTVTAMGQEQVTRAVNVNVQDNKNPLYLVVSSSDPIIWRFTGHTDAIKHVSVSSHYQNENEKSGSGVTGIPRDRVSFLSQRCFPHFNEGHELWRVRGKIRMLMGRFPNFLRTGNVRDIVISQGDVSFTPIPSVAQDSHAPAAPNPIEPGLTASSESEDLVQKRQKLQEKSHTLSNRHRNSYNPYKIPTPPGYDKELWDIFLSDYPGGLAELDASRVVSDMPAENYQILPQMAGIAKLVSEGVLIKISKKEFLVTKQMLRFPPGFNGGANSVKFVVPAGVKVPEGNPGQSCVMIEEAGEIVDKSPACD